MNLERGIKGVKCKKSKDSIVRNQRNVKREIIGE